MDSPTAAKRVKREIVLTAGKLSTHPEMFQVDEIMGDSDLNIRRFFRWNYRVIYQVLEKEVVILNVFHTRTNLSEEE